MDIDQQNEWHALRSAMRGDKPYSKIKPYATLLRVADAEGKRALHWAIEHHNDPNVVKLVISRYPEALLSQYNDRSICHFTNKINTPHELLVLTSWTVYKMQDFPRLFNLCGTSPSVEALDVAHSEENLSLRVGQGASAHQEASSLGCSR